MTRIHGILCMIGKHPVIIVFEVEEVGFPSIQEEFIIPEYRFAIGFMKQNFTACLERGFINPVCYPFLRYDDAVFLGS